MADRFPLIANSSANQIQEIASGDTIDLTGNMVDNAVNVKATGITTLSNTTDSTSSTTGGLIVSGGVGVAKNLFVGDAIDVTKDIKVGAAATVTGSLTVSGGVVGNVTGTATGLTGTPNISCGTIAGSTGTFSSAVNVDATTDSTSATSGALIVDGGLGVAKNVYIGAGLSVAGTLTYEDVTSVDSVGLITAKSGVNVTGGQLQVGVAYSVGSAGITTGLGFVCGSSGFNGEAGTSNFGALNVGNAGEFKVGTGVTIASTSGVSTFAEDTHFIGAGAKNLQWDKSAGQLDVLDNTKIKFGSGGDFSIFHDGSDNYISGDVDGMDLFIRSRKDVTISCGNAASGYHSVLYADNNGSTRLYHPDTDAIKLQTTNDGVSITGMTTTSAGMTFNGMLKEEVNIVANKLSAGTNVDVADGMVHYYSTNETTTATPNIRFNSSYTLNNKMSVGQTVSVTIIYKPNNAGYYAQLQVDGSNVTEYWNGGSAPAAANAGGLDVLTHTITKTANATFDVVLSNVQNYAS